MILPLVAVETLEVMIPKDPLRVIFQLVEVEENQVILQKNREAFKNIGVILPLVVVESMEVNLPTNRERIRPEEDLGVVFHVVALEGTAAHHWVATSIRVEPLSKFTSIDHLLYFC